jgi:hypothetical protein
MRETLWRCYICLTRKPIALGLYKYERALRQTLHFVVHTRTANIEILTSGLSIRRTPDAPSPASPLRQSILLVARGSKMRQSILFL